MPVREAPVPGAGGLVVWRSMKMRLRADVCLLIALTCAVRATAWTPPGPLATTGQDSLDPSLSVDAAGKAHVVWRERVSGGVFKIQYTSNESGAFAAPIDVTSSGGSPVVAADSGDVHVAWIFESTNFEIMYRRRSAGIWGTILNASNTPIKSLRPAVAARGAVGPVVAWDEAVVADDNYETYFSDWNGSAFSPAINISNTPGGNVYGSVNVNVAITPNGDLTAVWAERISGNYLTNARRRVNGFWQARQDTSNLQTGPSTPGIAAGADNRVHITYESDGRVYYQRWNGSAWAAPQALPDGLSGVVRPRVAVDEDGFAYVVADAFTDAQNNRDIFYSTNAGGSWSGWVNISNTTATGSLIGHIGYGAGQLTVIWQDNSNGAGGKGVYNVWYTTQPRPSLGPNGTLTGFVRNGDGQPIANATVSVGGRETASGHNGAYTLTRVPAGTYTVSASKLFFSTHNVPGVSINAGATVPLDFVIQPTPPAAVTNLAVMPGNTTNRLTWTHSSAGNAVGVMIRFKTTGFPSDPSDGTLAADVLGIPATPGSFEHNGLQNGLTYYYAVFAHTEDPVYAAAVTATAVPYGPADFDRDGDVDQEDFGRFQACYSGSAVPQIDASCSPARLDGDEDVDLNDFAVFQGCMSGAQVPANPNCRGSS